MIRIFAAAAVVLAGAIISTSAGAAPHSALYIFKDIASAPGHQRSHAVKFADIRACGADRDDEVSKSRVHALLTCMRARGWVVSRIERGAGESAAPPPVAVQSGDDQASDSGWWTTEEENATEEEDDQFNATEAAGEQDLQDGIDAGAAAQAAASQQSFDQTEQALGQQ